MRDLNQLAAQIHKANKKWWTDERGVPVERNRGELLMLVITELSEAVEGIRKDLFDDHLPHRKMEEVEMADAKIRLLDFAGGFGIEITPRTASQRAPYTENKGENILCICWAVCQINLGEDECDYLSGTISAIDDYCEKYSLDLDGAIEEKLAYNATREDHSHEARKAAGGKKF